MQRSPRSRCASTVLGLSPLVGPSRHLQLLQMEVDEDAIAGAAEDLSAVAHLAASERYRHIMEVSLAPCCMH